MAKPAPASTPTVYLEGIVGTAITAAGVRAQLAKVAGAAVVRVEINSDGGSITAGMAVYSALRQFPGRKVGVVMGMAASMATVLLQACDDRRIARGAFMMVHGASGDVRGTPGQLRDAADAIDKMQSSIVEIYAARTKLSRAKLESLMTGADTYLTAEEAVKLGFADAVENFDAKVPYDAVAQLQRDPSPGARRVLLALGRGRPLLTDPTARAAQYLAQARRARQ